MNWASTRRLVLQALARDRQAALSSTFGIVVGTASLVFFIALGLGVGQVLRSKVFPVDARLVEVVPPQVSLGLLSAKLDTPTVDRLKALPGVTAAWPKMNVRVPAVSVYDGDFFGRRLRMGVEVLAVGVDASFLGEDVTQFTDPGPGQPIPVVVSARLLEIYNKSFAPARGLPQLSGSMLTGFGFPIDFNRSSVTPSATGPVVSVQARVAGVSERGVLAGLTVPLAVAQRLNRAAGVDSETFSAVSLQAADPGQVPSLVAQVTDMGLRVDDQDRRWSENVGAAVALTTAALALLSGLICLLAAFNISHALAASVRTRERDLGVMRAVGATRRNILTLVLAEAAVLGLLGGALGTVLARFAGLGVDHLSARVLPEFPFKPETYFSWPPWLVVAGLGLGVVAAVLGALGPARRAARIDPARVLAGQGA